MATKNFYQILVPRRRSWNKQDFQYPKVTFNPSDARSFFIEANFFIRRFSCSKKVFNDNIVFY
jgi:hypothetical protein